MAPPPLAAAFKGLCPRCGARGLFDGPIRFAPKCRACGLDFTAFNVGDGPAAFLTLIVGAVVVIGAVTLELAASPPFWVHILLWPAIALALVVGGLRVSKAALLQSEYRNAAREGRIED
ncbi:MAG: DUF983 domain-containing protein [Sphingomonadaceae bacterium]|nr:DUF983 domain-containing protein [Sphingomonadaceae bacterium]